MGGDGDMLASYEIPKTAAGAAGLSTELGPVCWSWWDQHYAVERLGGRDRSCKDAPHCGNPPRDRQTEPCPRENPFPTRHAGNAEHPLL